MFVYFPQIFNEYMQTQAKEMKFSSTLSFYFAFLVTTNRRIHNNISALKIDNHHSSTNAKTTTSDFKGMILNMSSQRKFLDVKKEERGLIAVNFDATSDEDSTASEEWDDAWTASLAAEGLVPQGAALLVLQALFRPALAEQRRLLRLQRLLHARGLRAAAGGAAAWQRLRAAQRPAALLPAGAAGARLLRQLQGPEAMLLPLARGATRRLLARAPLRFDSALLLAQWRGRGRGRARGVEVRLAEAWRAGAGRPLELRPLGAWWPGGGESRGVRPPPAPPSPRRLRTRADLRGVTFRAVSGYWRLTGLEDDEDDLFYVRAYEEIWSFLETFNNFSTSWLSRNYSDFGTLRDDGTWKGIMKLLKDRNADVALGDISITPRRLHDADFTDPIYDQRIGSFMGLPARRSLKWTDFFMPFSKHLWTAAVGAALCLALSLAFVVWVGRQRNMAPRDAWLFVSAAFCQQGQPVSRAWSGRILCVGAHLLALVLTAAHSGALISSLFAGEQHLPFKSLLEALYDSSSRFYVTSNTSYFSQSYHIQAYLSAISEKLKEMELEGDPPPYVLDTLRRVCDDPRAIAIFGVDLLPILMPRVPCHVEELPSAQIANPISIALTKRNPYVQLFSYYIRRMRRTGVLARVLRSHWPQWPQQKDEASQPAVRLGDVAPLFPAFAAGALLALLLLAFERRLHAFHRNGQQLAHLSDTS